MSDEEVIDIAKTGNKQALDYLINKYKDLVNLRVNKYYIIGAEKEDIIQICRYKIHHYGRCRNRNI